MKKVVCIIIFAVMLIFFLFAPEAAIDASRRGLMLWFNQLLPTLLPFSILSYVLLNSNIFNCKPLSVRGKAVLSSGEIYIILCGFLFGFPIGSKLTADLYSQNQISRERAELLFIFTNNLSPAFVLSVFHEQLHRKPDLIIFLILYGIPFLYGILQLRKSGCDTGPIHKNKASRFQLNMQIVDAGIVNGFETLIKICGYIIMFSISAEMIKSLPLQAPVPEAALVGCLEVTNGVAAAADIASFHLKYFLIMVFLSWGGVSGFFQTASIVSNAKLPMKKYLLTRLFIVLLTALAAGLQIILTVHFQT